MKDLIFYGMVFVILYLSYILFVIVRKKKLEKFSHNTYIKYLESVYQLDMKTISIRQIAHVIAIANSLIITGTLYAIGITDNYVLKIMLAFVVLIPLQLIVYHIIGKCYQMKHKKGVK